MIDDSRREAATVATPIRHPAVGTGHVRIEVTIPEEEDKLWAVVSDSGWSGKYLGKNVFVFTLEQVVKIEQAGVKIRKLD